MESESTENIKQEETTGPASPTVIPTNDSLPASPKSKKSKLSDAQLPEPKSRQLIQYVKGQECIYGKKPSKVMRKDWDDSKEKAYDNIAQKLDITPDQCMRFWSNLRQRYSRESANNKKGIKSKWKYYHDLNFLETHINPKQKLSGSSFTSSPVVNASTSAEEHPQEGACVEVPPVAGQQGPSNAVETITQQPATTLQGDLIISSLRSEEAAASHHSASTSNGHSDNTPTASVGTMTTPESSMLEILKDICTEIDIQLPVYVCNMLSISGYCDIKLIRKMDERDVKSMEEFIATRGLWKRVIPEDELIVFFQRLEENQYCILPAHRRMLSDISEKLK